MGWSGDPGETGLRWTIPLEFAGYARIEELVPEALRAAGVEDPAAYQTQLVIEEVVLNLVKHAAPAQDVAGPGHEATVEVDVEAAAVTVRVEDRCAPFDPLAAAPADVTAPLEQRRAGGLGLHLVRSVAQEVRYEQDGDLNRLTVRIPR